ncbi:hypothetical protein BGZ83_011173 [Gryganskiella cystojenkinii]|nr:hypothetical protein BGZ83_011173 [Gryganskiella cystojenkinii]
MTETAEIVPPSGEASLLQIQTSIQPPAPPSGPQSTLNRVGDTAFQVGTTLLATKDKVDKGLEDYSALKSFFGDSKNEVLNNMIQLTDKLVDIGQAAPFIAPVFVVLKFIIDIETKAREVDEKCQDLIERINFMVSHMLVLERIEIMDTLKTVLQKVQDVLKEAAALIEAYRKQGKIARRLKMSNTQNFETMAGKISGCSSDLMMSLQIQQTGDLSVLKRSVPKDLVAENFVKENGGQDVVNFADKMQLTVSDQVMEQMKSNMQELVKQNRLQIEDLMLQSSSTTIADIIKAVAAQQKEVEAEYKLICVQCGKDYVVADNGPRSCQFHSRIGNMGYHPCCERESPCRKGYHQPDHHCKYPYSAFFLWAFGVIPGTTEYWANIRDVDLDIDDCTQIVRVGKLLRWKCGLGDLTEPLMLVNVGDVREDRLCYLKIFSANGVEEARLEVLRTGNTLIFKNASEDETSSYSMAEWVMDQESQQITGIKVTVKVTNSKTAAICIVPIDPKVPAMPSGKSLEYLSRAKTEIFLPDKPYAFPETIFRGPHLRETRLREPRTFKTRASPKVPLLLMPAYEMVANQKNVGCISDTDLFQGCWRAFNKSPVASQNHIILLSVKAEYRLVGEKEYKPVKEFSLGGNTRFPIPIAPMETENIAFEFTVDKPEEVVKRRAFGDFFAHVAIHHPLRVRLTFTDMEGETVSYVEEFVHKVNGVTLREEEDLGYFYADDIDLSQRTRVNISTSTYKGVVVDIRAGFLFATFHSLTEVDLRRIAHKAETTGITHVDMGFGETKHDIDWNIWALVDLSCKRVYGFKVILKHGSNNEIKYAGCLGYAPCPLYGGEGLEVRPRQYADEEKIELVTEHRDEIEVIEDDSYDDDVVPESAPAVIATATAIAEVAENEAIVAVVASSSPTSAVVTATEPSSTAIELLEAKVAALVARLEAVERHLALEKK